MFPLRTDVMVLKGFTSICVYTKGKVRYLTMLALDTLRKGDPNALRAMQGEETNQLTMICLAFVEGTY